MCILKAAWGVCKYVWMGRLCSSVRGVTKHRDQSPSLMSVNWVSDGVSINSKEIYVYRKCLLLMQHVIIDSNYLLRKKRDDSGDN